MKRTDRMIGIILGLLIGIAAVIQFVFGSGQSSLDDPTLEPPGGVEVER
jgi:hypothetical protein